MKKTLLLLTAAVLAACSAPESKVEWQPAGDRIRTQWADDVNPSAPLPEYPRPQMVRPDWLSLNGLWDYAITPADAPQPETFDGRILVPFCVESSLSGVGRPVTGDDALWYATSFSLPKKWKDRVLLHFGAVDYAAELWLNGRYVGSHKGGYAAFSFDITPYIKKGKQELVLKVLDGTDNDEQPRGKQVLHPNGIWYTAVSGIWQSVWVEPVGSTYVSGYQVVPSAQSLSVEVSVTDALPSDAVEVRLLDGETLVASAETVPGEAAVLVCEAPRLWSPDDPFLYGLEITVRRGRKAVDAVRGYTAFRTVSEVAASDGQKRIGINGEPVFLFGPLDQGWWPDGLYTAPTDEALKSDIERTKAFGYNFIRKHVKVEPARWYYWCDVLGVAVWQDMPNYAVSAHWSLSGYDTGEDFPLTDTARENYLREWGEIVDQHRSFPCIVAWVPFNEAWGQFDTEEVVARTKEMDPTRLVNPASGGNFRRCGDILDQHHYPNPAVQFNSGCTQIDVLGEYGGIGWPVEGHLWQPDRNWGYVRYASGEEVLAQYEEYALQLKQIIADGISAAVYTQTTDVEGEVNGLMTYDRKVVKMNEERLREINRDVIASLKK